MASRAAGCPETYSPAARIAMAAANFPSHRWVAMQCSRRPINDLPACSQPNFLTNASTFASPDFTKLSSSSSSSSQSRPPSLSRRDLARGWPSPIHLVSLLLRLCEDERRPPTGLHTVLGVSGRTAASLAFASPRPGAPTALLGELARVSRGGGLDLPPIARCGCPAGWAAAVRPPQPLRRARTTPEHLRARTLSSLEVESWATAGAMARSGAAGSRDCAAYAGWKA
mmetsp:Transcript_105235/g.285786  ORF Transcript_105235/g.285786 Transcript_105235/m.285786 type:complete len:227 (-) Transcript_105235:8-688(-)